MEKKIQEAVIAAVKELYGQEIPEKLATLQKTRAEFEGNLTLVVFPFLKMSKKAPEATAEEIGQYLKEHCSAVSGYNVVKGFLNLSIGGNAWINVLNEIDANPHYGEKPVTEKSPLVMPEIHSCAHAPVAATNSMASMVSTLAKPESPRLCALFMKTSCCISINNLNF